MVAYSNSNDINQQYDMNTQHKSIKRPATKASSNSQQPKVYKVKPIHFRQLVQELTGSHAQQQPDPRRASLQSVAPPPLPLNSHARHFPTQTQTQIQPKLTEKPPPTTLDSKPSDKNQGWEGISELNLSPNFQAWFNFAMLSPGPAPVSQ